jgi:hypothetical protein
MIKSTTKSTAKSLVQTDRKRVAKSEAATPNSMKKGSHNRVSKFIADPASVETPAAGTTTAEIPTPISATPRTTKQNQVLTLLAQTGGVTIDEVMRATGWQEHSVRGFFAGTVRKKLGFELTSEKAGDDDRRYAIKAAA